MNEFKNIKRLLAPKGLKEHDLYYIEVEDLKHPIIEASNGIVFIYGMRIPPMTYIVSKVLDKKKGFGLFKRNIDKRYKRFVADQISAFIGDARDNGYLKVDVSC